MECSRRGESRTLARSSAAAFKLLSFFLEKSFGELSQVLIGVIYILIVLFFPYGIVGTWRLRSFEIQKGRQRLLKYFRSALGFKQPAGE